MTPHTPVKANTPILVTGGLGYIGSHTVVELLSAGYPVIIVDDLSNAEPDVLTALEQLSGRKIPFYAIDCCDAPALEQVFAIHHPQATIHFAAYKAVGESVEKPLAYYRNNLLSLINLLEAMHKYEAPRLVFSSSCTVYGEPEQSPVSETTPVQPATSPYGNSKKINEEIIRDTVAAHPSMRAVLLRYFNPIGAHPSGLIGENPHGIPQNLVPFITQTAAGMRKELSIFGNDYGTPDGTCIRDYIDVVDLAQAHVAALDRLLFSEETAPLEVYNIGTGRGLSVLELVHAFERATGVTLSWRFAPRRAGDIEAIWADASLARERLGFVAETPIDETLRNAWQFQQYRLGK